MGICMRPLSTQMLLDFWSPAALQINLVIFLKLLGALLLGCVVGYERAYHGGAAGMRTYGLLSIASGHRHYPTFHQGFSAG